MTTPEFLRALATLRWTPGQVAQWCGYSRQSGLFWKRGERRIPEPVAAWVAHRAKGGRGDAPGRIGK